MKKGFKKQIEHELTEAIHIVLSGHNNHAVAKAQKAIKEASKLISKKFAKAIKALDENVETVSKGKKKVTSKVKPDKSVTAKKINGNKLISVRGANGRFVSAKRKVNLPASGKRKVAHLSN
jgi:hypothetical protein